MFIDEAEIYVKAGNGGDGAVSFRHEKFLPKGGPDGGDGGRGGDLIFEADNNINGLSLFNYQKRFLAEDGQNGMNNNKSGKSGRDLILKIPVGTQIYRKGVLELDMILTGTRMRFLKGGNGGWGNQHFATSIKQAPAWSKDGMRGESAKIKLVLKTIADVGLVGLPNAGKSTLLSVVSSARPKIADYPFTTLEPNLGVIKTGERNIILADIPGLIEGAAKGKGLGHKFLRHIERTKVLIHLIDANSPDVARDYQTVRTEIDEFSRALSKKKEIVVLNKIDSLSKEVLAEKVLALKKIKITPLPISSAAHAGLENLVNSLKEILS